MTARKPIVIDSGTVEQLFSTDQLEIPAGTAALPSLTFSSDPNTGIYSSAADEVSISTNGTQRVLVDSNGDVFVRAAAAAAAANRRIDVDNLTTGAGQASVYLANDINTGRYFEITYHSRGYATSGLLAANQATFLAAGANGVVFGTFASAQPAGDVVFVHGGTSAGNQRLNLKSAEVSVNENAQNVDFRVESQTNANMLFVDASANAVGVGTVTPATALDVNGVVTADGITLDSTGGLAVGATSPSKYAATSPAQITSNQNDYNLGTGTFFRINSDASRDITGLANGADGRMVYLANVGANSIVLKNQDTGSSAANRIITGTGADVTLAANNAATLIYDATDSRWRVMSVQQ